MSEQGCRLCCGVLVGGKSTRFGADKRFFRYRRKTLVEHAVDVARGVTPHVFISCSRQDAGKFEHLGPVIVDRVEGRGPMAGIVSVLRDCGCEVCVFLPVDMPHLTSTLLAALSREVGGTGVCLEHDGRLDPLVAAYTRRALPHFESALRSGDYAMKRVLRQMGVRTLGRDFIARFGDPDHLLVNINRQADIPNPSG